MANKNGIVKMLTKKGVRIMQTTTPDSKEWITIISCMNAPRQYLPNSYVFKGVRNTNKDCTILCEDGATQ